MHRLVLFYGFSGMILNTGIRPIDAGPGEILPREPIRPGRVPAHFVRLAYVAFVVLQAHLSAVLDSSDLCWGPKLGSYLVRWKRCTHHAPTWLEI